MRIENKRIIFRKGVNKTIIEDNSLGFISIYEKNNTIRNLDLNEYRLLDFSRDGKILLLNSKELLTRRNTNKTILTAFNIETSQTLFKTESFWAYRAIIDKTSSKFLLEYWNGLCCVDLNNGETLFRKDKINKNVYNADLHINSNKIYLPTEKKSLLTFDFNSNILDEIKLDKVASTTWIKFNKSQDKLLVSDKKNFLNCFMSDTISKPIWSIDFSKFGDEGRIWCFEILVTEANLGCVHGFMPKANQNAHAAGTLWIFDINTGTIVNKYDYANFNQKIICDYSENKIILDDLKSFSLADLNVDKTKYSDLIRTE
ncbi:hypothetical protein [Flavobacterium filum]|uniref:hypothetical protein n=1 Tax=Flavobacterium filum TaxID=370974 RepID=UPI0023F2881A|nr:hypothetical protein [Flavobacterium filum]